MIKMETRIEPLYKSKDKIEFGWNKEPGDVETYNIYVGTAGIVSAMTSFVTGVKNYGSQLAKYRGKVAYPAEIADVRSVLSLPSTVDFSNVVLYWTLTTVDSSGAESALADSTIVTVHPVGIDAKLQKDDHSIDRHIYGFSDDLIRWIKLSASGKGALITDASDYYKDNIITEYTYDGTNLSTTRSYPSDMTTSGSPAKLTTYEYSGSDLIKTTITDSTVI